MIAVKMGNEDMRDLAPPDLVLDHLDLGALTAIHQVIISVVRNHLAGGMTVESRYGGVVSQYGYRKHVGKNTEKFGGMVKRKQKQEAVSKKQEAVNKKQPACQ